MIERTVGDCSIDRSLLDAPHGEGSAGASRASAVVVRDTMAGTSGLLPLQPCTRFGRTHTSHWTLADEVGRLHGPTSP
jgi:hypothetical protein